MKIVVQLSQEAAAELARREEGRPEQHLPGLQDLGLTLEPMHPGESDPTLSPYFTAEVSDPAAAERAIGALSDNEAVEAAYVKPAEEPP